MKFVNKMLTGALAVLVFTVALTACGGGSSSAAPTPSAKLTQAQFDALLVASTAFQAQATDVGTLQKQMKRLPFGNLPKTTNAARTSSVTMAVAPDFGTCTDEGLLIGSALGANAALGTVASRITCNQYEYSYSTKDGSIEPLPGMEWDGANCSGNVYATQVISPGLALNGYVFSMPGQSDNSAVAAGTELQTVQVLSQSDSTGNCIDNSGSPFNDDVYSIVSNDPNVTGVPNAAVPAGKNGG